MKQEGGQLSSYYILVVSELILVNESLDALLQTLPQIIRVKPPPYFFLFPSTTSHIQIKKTSSVLNLFSKGKFNPTLKHGGMYVHC